MKRGKRRFRRRGGGVVPSQVVMIYQSELDVLSRYILDYPRLETGGAAFWLLDCWGCAGGALCLGAGGAGESPGHLL